jgi:hypothetical protein
MSKHGHRFLANVFLCSTSRHVRHSQQNICAFDCQQSCQRRSFKGVVPE